MFLKLRKIKAASKCAKFTEKIMNHSIQTTNFDGNGLANDIWAMLGTGNSATAAPPETFAGIEENVMNNAPDLTTEILSKHSTAPSLFK